MKDNLFPHTFLMCKPQYYSVSYRINPWMEPSKNPSHWEDAMSQWTELHHTIIRLGGWVEYIEPQPGLPDMVFAANHAFITLDGKHIVATFSHEERKRESDHVIMWFANKNIETISLACNFEGAGDALYAGDILFCGHGFRSDKRVADILKETLKTSPNNIVSCKLVNDYFYHLDTCFCPLDADNALVFSEAFDEDSLSNMKERINLIHVPEQDAKKFACNAVVLGKDVIIPAGCQETEDLLKDNGYNPHSVEMGEFIKAGGACKCCTLKLR